MVVFRCTWENFVCCVVRACGRGVVYNGLLLHWLGCVWFVAVGLDVVCRCFVLACFCIGLVAFFFSRLTLLTYVGVLICVVVGSASE